MNGQFTSDFCGKNIIALYYFINKILRVYILTTEMGCSGFYTTFCFQIIKYQLVKIPIHNVSSNVIPLVTNTV